MDKFILVIIGLILFIFIINRYEHLQTANEAVFNISKVYSDTRGTVAFNNIKVTNDLDVSGLNSNINKLNINDLSANTITSNNIRSTSNQTDYINVKYNIDLSGNVYSRGAGSTFGSVTTGYLSNNGESNFVGNVIAPNITSTRIYSPNRVHFIALGDDGFIRVYRTTNDAAPVYRIPT